MQSMTSVKPESQVLSKIACQRCFKRKKKCDRVQPQCSSCRHAKTPCIFLENTSREAVFKVAYVHTLEKRVLELESELKDLRDWIQSNNASLAAGQAREPYQSQTQVNDGSGKIEIGATDPPTDINSRTGEDSTSPNVQAQALDSTRPHHHLASELENLSLTAVAEKPFLGSSSGVSFARLTQAVLRRLQPDQLAFDGSKDNADDTTRTQQPEETLPMSSTQQSEDIQVSLPSREHASHLEDFYWSHSHTLYPFLQKAAFKKNLSDIYDHPERLEHLPASVSYRVWMVFAIGSTTWSSISVGDGKQSTAYFQKAMTYFERVLMEGNIVAIEALMLQVVYSFFTQFGPNTWYLIGSAMRIAIGIGLHTKQTGPTTMVDEERRKRLFWCLFMADRVVSIALGRPLGIREEEIEIEVFTDVDDENILSDRIIPQSPIKISELAVPSHILRLRQIASEIFETVYAHPRHWLSPDEKGLLLSNIHNKLLAWRRNMPFPLPESRSPSVPHLTTVWYDMNYYNHVITLYRPSPLCPRLDLGQVHLIANASALAIRKTSEMHKQVGLACVWLNLFTLFTATLTLIYSISAQPDPLPLFLERSGALADLDLAIDLLGKFEAKLPDSRKYRDMTIHIRELLQRQIDNQRDLHQQVEGPSPLSISNRDESNVFSGSSYPLSAMWNQQYDTLISRVRDEGLRQTSSEEHAHDVGDYESVDYAMAFPSEVVEDESNMLYGGPEQSDISSYWQMP